MRGIINLQTYSRPSILKQCLESIENCRESKNYLKLIVLQVGNREVEDLVHSFAKKNPSTEVITVDGFDKSPLENMNWNRWLAWERGFDLLQADWIFSIEEDIVLHPNSIHFVSTQMNAMYHDKRFRGINLGSKLVDPNLACTFSKLRFGLHGCAGAITKETWKEIKALQIERKIKHFPLDSCIEHILKDGYMVTPNLSHYLDYGWFQGTHTDSNPNHEHYIQVEQSYKINPNNCKQYLSFQVDHKWRYDCIAYDRRQNFHHKVRKYSMIFLQTHTWINFYSMMRRVKQGCLRAINKTLFSSKHP